MFYNKNRDIKIVIREDLTQLPYNSTPTNTLKNNDLHEKIKKIYEHSFDITNKTVYFLNGIEIKQEIYKQKFNLKTTKDPAKADYIIYGNKHIQNPYMNKAFYYIDNNIIDMLNRYNHKYLYHRNIKTVHAIRKNLSLEEAIKMFRMSCSDEETNQTLLKTLIVDIDYNEYPLFVAILLRKIRYRSKDNVFSSYTSNFYDKFNIRLPSIYSNTIILEWILNNQTFPDIDLVVDIFNSQLKDFELKKKEKAAVIETTNKWDL
jgi:hypothetical protein